MKDKNNYTKVPNEFIKELASTHLNGTQSCIMLVIIRYTYGFNRNEAPLSVSFISNYTNLNKQQIKRELKRLIEYKILNIIKPANFNSSRVIAINLDYTQWNSSVKESKKAPSNQPQPKPGNKSITSTGNELSTSPGSNLSTQEIKINNKNNNKRYINEQSISYDKNELILHFNSICNTLPKIKELNIKQLELLAEIKTRIPELSFDELFNKVNSSEFLSGRNGKWLGCSFDWIISPENTLKILAGNYDNKIPSTKMEDYSSVDRYKKIITNV